jgi:hypothetical protein
VGFALSIIMTPGLKSLNYLDERVAHLPPGLPSGAIEHIIEEEESVLEEDLPEERMLRDNKARFQDGATESSRVVGYPAQNQEEEKEDTDCIKFHQNLYQI